MKPAGRHLPHILAEDQPRYDFALAQLDSYEAKRLARQWGCKEASKLRKEPCVAYLAGALKDPARARERWQALGDDHKAVLSVFKRYGGALPGEVLVRELLTRGIVREPSRGEFAWQRGDPVESLRHDKLLVSEQGPWYSSYSHSWWRTYPRLVAHPGLLDLADVAAPLSWKASKKTESPSHAEHRTPAEVALDLTFVAKALADMGEWNTLRGGSLSASQRSRLAKSVPIAPSKVIPVPESACLYYELLRCAGTVEIRESVGRMIPEQAKRLLAKSSPEQARIWTRAWIEMSLWQDGIGVVPDRDNYQDPVRIEPDKLRTARKMLAWALTRVAHGGSEWLDLDVFLKDLWKAAGKEGIDFYWGRYAWDVNFPAARGKESIPLGDARSFAFWLDTEGGWVANAIFGTLYHLGLVERGTYAGRTTPRCFRLTPLGRIVFGAPEVPIEGLPAGRKFLTVQPNQDVIAYLEDADAGEITTLARIAQSSSSEAGAVRTYRFTRASVYAALEDGLQPDEIRAFLERHSRTGIPSEVESLLSDSHARREALVVRSGVSLHAQAPGDRTEGGRPIGEQWLLKAGPGHERGESAGKQEAVGSPRCWTVDEDGIVHLTGKLGMVALARLARIAERDGEDWRVTRTSVTTSRERGVAAETLLGWLQAHSAEALPPTLVAAIHNWAGAAEEVFLGDVCLLQVPSQRAQQAIVGCARASSWIVAHPSADLFIIRTDRRAELQEWLDHHGFVTTREYRAVSVPVERPDDRGELIHRKPRAGRARPRALLRQLSK